MKWKPLLAHVFPDERIVSTQPLAGGCINYCYKIVTNRQAYFVKFNNAQRYPRMYACEAFGLNAMKRTKAVNTPTVLKQGEVEDMTFLVLAYIAPGRPTEAAMQQLGHDLATMHRHLNSNRRAPFGFDHDNFIGSLSQANDWCNDWFAFYEQRRVMPLCEKLLANQSFALADVDACRRYLDAQRNVVPAESPSLLHGDLWSGNFLISNDGQPYLIDPACYYGHREMDIAMTQLFGGFGSAFIEAYNESFPLHEGWQRRLNYFQLYPLLVHAVLFGSAYIDRVKNICHQGKR